MICFSHRTKAGLITVFWVCSFNVKLVKFIITMTMLLVMTYSHSYYLDNGAIPLLEYFSVI